MKLYNTLTRNIDLFNPNKKVIKMYTCGPTVYHYAHIGNLRTYIMEDILEKTEKEVKPAIIICMADEFVPMSRDVWLCPVGVI